MVLKYYLENHCVYVKWLGKDFLILSLYVNNILLTRSDMDIIVATKGWLSSTFDMKDMGKQIFCSELRS